MSDLKSEEGRSAGQGACSLVPALPRAGPLSSNPPAYEDLSNTAAKPSELDEAA